MRLPLEFRTFRRPGLRHVTALALRTPVSCATATLPPLTYRVRPSLVFFLYPGVYRNKLVEERSGAMVKLAVLASDCKQVGTSPIS